MTRFDGLNLLSAGDVIYPPVDDPYAVGKAACAHCLSALYACGVSEVNFSRNTSFLKSIEVIISSKIRI